MCHAAVWHAGHSWHKPLSTAGWAVHVAGHANAGEPRLTLLTVNQWIGRRAPRPLGTMTKGSVLPLLAATDGQAHMIFNLNDAACLLSSLFCSMWRTNPILKKCAGPFPPSIGAMNPYGREGPRTGSRSGGSIWREFCCVFGVSQCQSGSVVMLDHHGVIDTTHYPAHWQQDWARYGAGQRCASK